MSRVAAPLNCKEDEIISLNEIIQSNIYSDDMKRRANIILLANSGLSNKEIAAELDSNENTVALWRNRFIKDRLSGLHDMERPGRRGSKGQNKREAVIEAAQQNEHATVKELSEKAGTSEDTVRRALSEAGIGTANKRSYEISASAGLNKACIEIKGLYVSGMALAIVMRIDHSLSSPLEEGTLTSRNRELTVAAEGHVTLAEMLDLMCSSKKEDSVKEVSLDEFLKKTDDSLDCDTRHVAFIYSRRYKLPQGFSLKNMNMVSVQDENSWYACISACLNLLSEGNEGKKIYSSLARYIQSRTDTEEAFVWTKNTLSFDRSVRQNAINPVDLSAAFADASVQNIAWVKYGYATREGAYAEFTDTKENIFPVKDENMHGNPLKIASYAGEVVSGVRSLFAIPQKNLAEEYINGDGKKNGFAK